MHYDLALQVVFVLELVAAVEGVAVDKRWDPHRTAIAVMSNLAWFSKRTNSPDAGKRAVQEHPHFAVESST